MKDFLKNVFASVLGTMIALGMMTFFTLFLIFGIVGVIMATHGRSETGATLHERSILFIDVEGEVNERRETPDILREVMSGEQTKAIGLIELSDAIHAAMTDDKIKGIYLRLRWVSSGWSKLESFRKLLKEFKTSGKFIYAYSEAYDEKLYYLASVADEIYMYPKGEFEWNGLFIQPTFFKKTLSKLDVEPTLIRAGKFKAAGESFTEEKMTQENKLQLSELNESLWSTIVAEIAEDRKELTADSLNEWAQKLMVNSAQDAYNLKMVTQLMPIEEIEKRLLQATALGPTDDVPLVLWSTYTELTQSSTFLSSKDKIAVILAEGEIQMGSGSDMGAIYSDELSGLIRDINKEDDVKAVVLRVNSPGGSALASDVIWRSLQYLKKNKKVVTSFSDVAASGGYYIAAGTDYIFAEPTTITGSIGVFGLIFNASKFFDNKLGVTFDEVKSHDSSDMMSGLRPLSSFERDKIQSEVGHIYNTFLNVVQEGRKSFGSQEAVRDVAEGRVWTGAKAKEIGLVDEMGTLDQAIDKAAELAQLKDFEVVVYPDEIRWIDRIFKSFGDVFGLPPWLQNLLRIKHQPTVIYTRLPFTWEQ